MLLVLNSYDCRLGLTVTLEYLISVALASCENWL
jgi:hypothetical protein